MFARIIDLSIQNRLLVVLGALAVVVAGTFSLTRTPIDAIPDLSDVQVIIQTEYPGQAPRIVEDQVTYPLTTQMLAAPFAQVVRGYSFFGVSFVYVIFEDGTDLYWARSRVLEYLSGIQGSLPPSARVELGPDATGVGWVYEYVLQSDRHTLQELRSIQDWYLRFELTSVEGVAEVASIGGHVKQKATGASDRANSAVGTDLGFGVIKFLYQRPVDLFWRLRSDQSADMPRVEK